MKNKVIKMIEDIASKHAEYELLLKKNLTKCFEMLENDISLSKGFSNHKKSRGRKILDKKRGM